MSAGGNRQDLTTRDYGGATVWFREVNDICQPMTKERLLTKAG